MEYNVEDIDKILGFKTWTDRQKTDELLRIDASMYAAMGTDSLKSERKTTKKNSRKIYRAIKLIDRKMGDLFLKMLDDDSE